MRGWLNFGFCVIAQALKCVDRSSSGSCSSTSDGFSPPWLPLGNKHLVASSIGKSCEPSNRDPVAGDWNSDSQTAITLMSGGRGVEARRPPTESIRWKMWRLQQKHAWNDARSDEGRQWEKLVAGRQDQNSRLRCSGPPRLSSACPALRVSEGSFWASIRVSQPPPACSNLINRTRDSTAGLLVVCILIWCSCCPLRNNFSVFIAALTPSSFHSLVAPPRA